MNTLRLTETKPGKSKPKRFVFTIQRLTAIRPPAKGVAWVYDLTCPGLTLCVTANDARTYYLYRKIGGKPERIKLGKFSDIQLDDARRLANKEKGRIADGQNPATDKRFARGDSTFLDAFKLFIELHKKPKRKTWKDDVQRHDLYLSKWSNRKLRSITRPDVVAMHNSVMVKTSKATANRVLSLIGAVFNKTTDPVYNPAKGVERFREVARQRYLTQDEVATLLKAIGAEQAIVADLFHILLFTGQRRGNVMAMQWSAINLEAKTWRIAGETTKNGEPIIVPLLPHAVEILIRRKAEAKANDEFVFPTWSKTGHISQPSAAWYRIVTRAGMNDAKGKPTIRIHDLRRTHASWLAMSGASASVVKAAMNHRSITTTMNVYAMVNSETVRSAGETAMTMMMKPTTKEGEK